LPKTVRPAGWTCQWNHAGLLSRGAAGSGGQGAYVVAKWSKVECRNGLIA